MRLFNSVLFACVMALSVSAKAAIVTIEVSDLEPSIDDVITVDILASTSGIPADTVGGFALSFLFDETRLSLASPLQLGADFIGPVVQMPALIQGATTNIFGLTGVDMLLARIQLLVVAEGGSSVGVTGNLFRGGFQPGFDLVDASQVIDVQSGGSVDPSEPVNAPATLGMLALVAGVLFARRKR